MADSEKLMNFLEENHLYDTKLIKNHSIRLANERSYFNLREVNKFCKKYKDQLNIEKIEYNFVSFGDYEDKMTSLVAGGDDFDGFFVADWMLYPKMANKGAFLPLNDLMQQYALLA